MKRVARSPGNADPESGTNRNDDVSYRARTSAGSSSMRRSITGTATKTSARCRAIRASERSGSKCRSSTIVSPSNKLVVALANPHAWKHGAAMTIFSCARYGSRSSNAIAAPGCGAPATSAPLGGPVVPDVKMMIRPSRAGRSNGGPSAWRRARSSRVRVACSEELDSSVQASRRASVAGRRRDRGELVVVHENDRPLPLHHFAHLRCREPSVEVQRVRAELRQRAGDLEEVAVVAAQDGNGVAGAHAGFDEPARDRVAACVELGEAHRPALVDERRLSAVARRAHREDRGEPRAPVPNRVAPCAIRDRAVRDAAGRSAGAPWSRARRRRDGRQDARPDATSPTRPL